MLCSICLLAHCPIDPICFIVALMNIYALLRSAFARLTHRTYFRASVVMSSKITFNNNSNEELRAQIIGSSAATTAHQY